MTYKKFSCYCFKPTFQKYRVSEHSDILRCLGYGLDNWGLIPGRNGEEIFFSSPLQTGSGAHPASCPVDIGVLSPRTKWQEHKTDHSPPVISNYICMAWNLIKHRDNFTFTPFLSLLVER